MLTPEEVQAYRQKYNITPTSQTATSSGESARMQRLRAVATPKDPRDEIVQQYQPKQSGLSSVYQDGFKPLFPANTKSQSVGEALKVVGNIPTSAANFGMGAFHFLNPAESIPKGKEAVEGLVKGVPAAIKEAQMPQYGGKAGEQKKQQTKEQQSLLASQATQAINRGTTATSMLNPITAEDPSVSKLVFDTVTGSVTEGAKAVVPESAQNLFSAGTNYLDAAATSDKNKKQASKAKGDEALQKAQKKITEDPVGQIAPFVLAAEQAKPGTVTKVAEKAGAKQIQKVTSKVTDVAKNAAGTATKFTVSQATGLAPETITTIKNNPEAFSRKNMQSVDRGSVAETAKNAIDQRIADLSETGKGYETIRKSPTQVTIPQNAVNGVLSKYGIEIDKKGKIVTTKESIPLSAGDKAALQDFVNTFGKEQNLSANALLNARTTLSNMAKYDSTKTGASTTLARELRSLYDTHGKTQLPELAKLDAQYAPEVQLLKQIKKDYLNADGSFKDNAINKIANLTGKGKEQVLGRLEKISPGIGDQIKILKAIEDIDAASGHKVGTYTRGFLAGGGGFLAGGLPGAIATAILTNPKVATQLIRAYGSLRGASAAAVNNSLKGISDFLNRDVKDISVGLTTKNVGMKESLQQSWDLLQKHKLQLKQQGLSESHPSVKNVIKSQKMIEQQINKLR